MTVRREIAQSPRETGARSREAGQHPAWEFRRGCAPFGGFYKGAGTLVGVGEAGFRAEPTREGGILEQDVDRPSGEPACLDAGPTASLCVATALARSIERPLHDRGAEKEYRCGFCLPSPRLQQKRS